MAGYTAPLDFRAPGGWRLSVGGVPIPPPPQGDALVSEVEPVLATMSDEQRAELRFFLENYEVWMHFFRDRYDRELAAYDGPPPPPACNNAAGHRCWWSALGRTLENVLAQIKGGNLPVLGMPPPTVVPSVSCRHESPWMPRRMAFSSSSSSASRLATRSCGSAPPGQGSSRWGAPGHINS
jgi:hypothetical protein